MQFAIDEQGRHINIKHAAREGAYYCPICKCPMRQRRGNINIHHFAHAPGCECTDNWHYEEMCEWHHEWQRRYPDECQEYVMRNENEIHRADVFINNMVIEFQHSPISVKEFDERNQFYTRNGHTLVWLFDWTEQYGDKLTSNEEETLFYWNRPRGIFESFDLYGSVHLYGQLRKPTNSDDRVIVRITGLGYESMSTSENEKYSVGEFIELTTSLKRRQRAIPIDKERFCFTLPIERFTNGALAVNSCLINADGIGPVHHRKGYVSCDECKFYIRTEKFNILCSARYQDFLNSDVYKMIEFYEIQEIGVMHIVYLDSRWNLRKLDIIKPSSSGKSIPELWKNYSPRMMIVRNVDSGWRFKIERDPIEQYEKYKRVYGFRQKHKDSNDFLEKSVRIKAGTGPFWVCESFNRS